MVSIRPKLVGRRLSLMKLFNSRVIRISIASILTGILIGLVGGAFRYCLIAADNGRSALIAKAHAWPHIGWLAPVALGLVGAALARFLVVRFAPIAEGSGVQRGIRASSFFPRRHRGQERYPEVFESWEIHYRLNLFRCPAHGMNDLVIRLRVIQL